MTWPVTTCGHPTARHTSRQTCRPHNSPILHRFAAARRIHSSVPQITATDCQDGGTNDPNIPAMVRTALLVGRAVVAFAATFGAVKLLQFRSSPTGMVWIPGGEFAMG